MASRLGLGEDHGLVEAEVASYLEGVVVGTALPCGEEVVAFDLVVVGEDVDQEAVQAVVEYQASWVETFQVAGNQVVASFQEEAYLEEACLVEQVALGVLIPA